ncbi:MAG TPA: TetR family transcriptional regulator [Burkholderiales bacterium]|nr:TetR family transcriptional regulator [Burkholderiales bacterium]
MSTYHHGDLRAALLKAAARILEKDGPDAISLRDLARSVDVSHNAPYRHFADRQALLSALADEGFSLLAAQLAGKPWREQAVSYVRFALAHSQRFRLMFAQPVPSELRRIVEGDAVAQATWAMVHGLTHLILAGHFPGEDPEALVRRTLAEVRFAQRSA